MQEDRERERQAGGQRVREAARQTDSPAGSKADRQAGR